MLSRLLCACSRQAANSLIGCCCVMISDGEPTSTGAGVNSRGAGEKQGVVVLSASACFSRVDLTRLLALIACSKPNSSGERSNALHTWSSVPSCGTCNPRSHRLKVLTLTPALSLATAMLQRLCILADSNLLFGVAIFPHKITTYTTTYMVITL